MQVYVCVLYHVKERKYILVNMFFIMVDKRRDRVERCCLRFRIKANVQVLDVACSPFGIQIGKT